LHDLHRLNISIIAIKDRPRLAVDPCSDGISIHGQMVGSRLQIGYEHTLSTRWPIFWKESPRENGAADFRNAYQTQLVLDAVLQSAESRMGVDSEMISSQSRPLRPRSSSSRRLNKNETPS